MADVLGLVYRLRQGPDNHALEHGRIRPAVNLLQRLLQHRWCYLSHLREEHATGSQEALQFINALFIGWRMYAKQGRHLLLVQEPRCLDVSGHHALLDETMGIVARIGLEVCHLAFRIHHHPHFRGFEIQRAALLTALPQGEIHLMQCVQRAEYCWRQALRGLAVAVYQNAGDARVGKTRM